MNDDAETKSIIPAPVADSRSVRALKIKISFAKLHQYERELNIVRFATKSLYTPCVTAFKEELIIALHLIKTEGDDPLVDRNKLNIYAMEMMRYAKSLDTLCCFVNDYESLYRMQAAQAAESTKYVALRLIAPAIAATMLSFSLGENLEVIGAKIQEIQGPRRDWVWAGGFYASLLTFMPGNIGADTQQAKMIFKSMAPVTGHMSYIGHYLLLGIELYLLVEGTLKGSWMDPWGKDESITLSIYERFSTQLSLRGFDLINYSFWGTLNLACFFMIVSSGLGDKLTEALFLMDFILVLCRYNRERIAQNEESNLYMKDIQAIRALLNQDNISPDYRDVLNQQLKICTFAYDKCLKEFEYEKFLADLCYAGALILSFALFCAFFGASIASGGLAPATVLILGVVGLGIGFLFTTVYHAYKTSLEIYQLESLCEDISTKIGKNEVAIANMGTDDTRKSLLTTENKQLDKEQAHYINLINHYKTRRSMKIISESFIPAAAFTLFMFAPIGLLAIPVFLSLVMILGYAGYKFEAGIPKLKEPEIESIKQVGLEDDPSLNGNDLSPSSN